jgi:hypothetical protein
MGNTATHLVLRAMKSWLASHPAGRRVAILFTDGAPDAPQETAREALAIRSAGIALLAGSLDDGLEHCSASLPGAILFTVHPGETGGSLLAALGVIRRLGL